jgi:hypothetical protein
MTLAHVPPPTDATQTEDWDWHGGNDWRRCFTINRATLPGAHGEVTVTLAGEQVQTGDVMARWAHVSGGAELSAMQLSPAAAACLNARLTHIFVKPQAHR